MKVAIVIGHSIDSQGACNARTGETEFNFNNEFGQKLKERLLSFAIGLQVEIVHRDSYAQLPQKINVLRPDFIISLHCNAFDTKASGSEVLFYQKSRLGELLANFLQEEIVNCLGLSNRGTKGITDKERGGYLLKNTLAPCVITEPFFIDNDEDLFIAISQKDNLVTAYSNAISHYCKALMQ